MKKEFTEPKVEAVKFGDNIIAQSTTCGCFDEFFCPTNYTNCTADGAGCECEINYSPAIANCIPCPTYEG